MKTLLIASVIILMTSFQAQAFDPSSLDYIIGQEDGQRQGQQQGIREGQAVGRKEGLQQGRNIGQTEGQKETKNKVADALGIGSGGGSGAYQYSGLPCKWTGPPRSAGQQSPLIKDTSPSPRYTLDRLPPSANSDEALWVKMEDGRLVMVDPQETQKLKR